VIGLFDFTAVAHANYPLFFNGVVFLNLEDERELRLSGSRLEAPTYLPLMDLLPPPKSAPSFTDLAPLPRILCRCRSGGEKEWNLGTNST
jgi:hypothetical protein